MPRENKSQKTSRKSILGPVLVLALLFLGIGVGYFWFKKSLFTVMKVPDFELTDQNNQKISNKDMLGKVYLVEFFYSRCPTICPVMNRNMQYIQNAVNSRDFGIISISIDPANDTPQILKAHAKMMGATSPNWHFLTGNREYIGKIADQFNIYVGDEESEAENLNHSGMVALVDQQGNIRCRYGENKMPVLYYSALNYADPAGKNADLKGKYHPDREKLIEDIQHLLK